MILWNLQSKKKLLLAKVNAEIDHLFSNTHGKVNHFTFFSTVINLARYKSVIKAFLFITIIEKGEISSRRKLM